ncbi:MULTISPECIES: VOC family protein [unclassified Enterococcus]|uniref:VOC family protein n=1 Tax=unclassified Enterococcus TaxID=2608891 RepID=UPI001A915CC7|nr:MULTISPECIES: VOC family protein [unclassified Enterococcus]MBO0461148.1 VOC family protein [Enterococcus sp. DIV1298c]MBO1300260.1 VOC family protein [Enterococcus sp. DIV1271a]
MKVFDLGSTTYLKSIAIRVKDRDKMIEFYKDTIGFDLKREENELAIFGTVENDSELLLLEESPRANDHFGEVKKLNRFSLIIPTLEEMADVLYRIRQTNQTIEEALESDGRIGILLKDPEGNFLEIYHEAPEALQQQVVEQLDQEALLRQSNERFTKLSAGTYFQKVHLNVLDMEKEQEFLSELLGLTVHKEEEKEFILNKGDFHVGLTQSDSPVIALPTDEVLGLDFLKFVIDPESMQRLIEHLNKETIDFYIDKKQKVLTLYDAVGIEWWFVDETKATNIIQ